MGNGASNAASVALQQELQQAAVERPKQTKASTTTKNKQKKASDKKKPSDKKKKKEESDNNNDSSPSKKSTSKKKTDKKPTGDKKKTDKDKKQQSAADKKQSDKSKVKEGGSTKKTRQTSNAKKEPSASRRASAASGRESPTHSRRASSTHSRRASAAHSSSSSAAPPPSRRQSTTSTTSADNSMQQQKKKKSKVKRSKSSASCSTNSISSNVPLSQQDKVNRAVAKAMFNRRPSQEHQKLEQQSQPQQQQPKEKQQQQQQHEEPPQPAKRKHHSTTAGTANQVVDEDPYANALHDGWKLIEVKFNGSATCVTMGKKETVEGKSINKGIVKFKANPQKYVAIMYQQSMLTRQHPNQDYTLIHRKGTVNYEPCGLTPDGQLTLLMYEYQRLPPFYNNDLPLQYRDSYTDHVLSTFRRRRLHFNKKPILPGRGMGVCDTPNLKIIGDVDPSDIAQGAVGNCWMLSGISALAEFDGAVKRLFRKTPGLDLMPRASDKGNLYTITLWDLEEWEEVDIVVDERLCANEKGDLLASKPSKDGELWVCYLEKALAAHCGGWDKIVGGQCTHAWALLTGCKEQYTIRKNKETGKYACYAKYNPRTKRWAHHANAPHECSQTVWRAPWPRVGGGGDETVELTQDELFQCMCAWDDENYIVGASTDGCASSKNKDEGLVDFHAYSVLESIANVAGTGVDLLKVRNPWGEGEIEHGMFDDDGPGWDKYPQIKKLLNPVVADDGIFWVTKQEFFKFYGTIYLSASNMTKFLED